MFVKGNEAGQSMNLADMLMQKLKANQDVVRDKEDLAELEESVASTMNPKVVEVY